MQSKKYKPYTAGDRTPGELFEKWGWPFNTKAHWQPSPISLEASLYYSSVVINVHNDAESFHRSEVLFRLRWGCFRGQSTGKSKGLPHMGQSRTSICFLKTLMGLVVRKSITLSLEAVSTSYKVDIKFLFEVGCLFVRESPSLRARRTPS